MTHFPKAKKVPAILLICAAALAACGSAAVPTATPTATDVPPTSTPEPTETPTPTATSEPTETPTPTQTPTPSDTPTPSETPTPTETPTLTPTPTLPPAEVTANAGLNCRYGPDVAYLYAWGLSEGDSATLDGRNYAATWLWVQPHDANFHCWITADGATPNVELSTVPVVYPPLQTNPAVSPPGGVSASRSGSTVTVSWSPAAPAVDLGYLIEARICTSGGFLLDVAYTTTSTSYSLTDSTSCSGDSYGTLRVQNKLGYSSAVNISWP
jgi:hypothetical protein